jgi:hypothetical protein
MERTGKDATMEWIARLIGRMPRRNVGGDMMIETRFAALAAAARMPEPQVGLFRRSR